MPLTSTRHAFTLIELLVVISIIAVLAAMLLPTINMVREGARQAQCSSSMRQWQLANLTYSADNEGLAMPSQINVTGGDQYYSFGYAPVRQYMGLSEVSSPYWWSPAWTQNDPVGMKCPSAPRNATTGGSRHYYEGVFGYNTCGFQWTNSGALPNGFVNFLTIRPGKNRKASFKLALADATFPAWGWSGPSQFVDWDTDPQQSQNPADWSVGMAGGYMPFRHRSKLNAVRWDGSAATFKYGVDNPDPAFGWNSNQSVRNNTWVNMTRNNGTNADFN